MVCRDIELHTDSWKKSITTAEFISRASEFKSSIWVEKDNKKANAKSLLGLLALGIAPGCSVRLIAEGDDAEAAVGALFEFMSQSV